MHFLNMVKECRTSFDIWMSILKLPQTMLNSRKGSGPIVLLPGFLATDCSLRALKIFLDVLGYDTYHTGQGRNLGPSDKYMKGIAEVIKKAHVRSGYRPVTLIGQSLGGLLARLLAYELGNKIVGQVITMGSPLNATTAREEVNPLLLCAADKIVQGGLEAVLNESTAAKVNADLGIPTTCIYSKWDGIVSAEQAQGVGSDFRSVKISSSHTAMGHSHQAYRVISEALA